jgi:UMP-CMP kinase family protein
MFSINKFRISSSVIIIINKPLLLFKKTTKLPHSTLSIPTTFPFLLNTNLNLHHHYQQYHYYYSTSKKPINTTKTKTTTMQTPLPRVLFILGAPGSGKGTVSTSLVQDYGVIHLSAGDLLREERTRPGSEHGALIESYIKEGKIVPVAITVGLLWKEIEKNMLNGKMHFLVDGFPRNDDNLRGWNEVVGKKARVVGVLFLDAPESVVEERLLERGKSSGRSDDNLASIKKRFVTYTSETRPILDLYDKKGMCWRVDAAQNKDVVYHFVRQLVDDRFIPKQQHVMFVLGGPGAGKGSQSARIAEEERWDATHLSAGDLLRAERQDKSSPDGQLIENYIKEGKIVPVEITVRLLIRAMERCGTRNVIVDGFPRNLDNVTGWEKNVNPNKVSVGGCLFFNCSEQEMEKRLLSRGEAAGVNRRSDDNIESIRKRFVVFHNETMPILQMYKDRGIYYEVDANRSLDEVWIDVEKLLLPIFYGITTSTSSSSSTISPSKKRAGDNEGSLSEDAKRGRM